MSHLLKLENGTVVEVESYAVLDNAELQRRAQFAQDEVNELKKFMEEPVSSTDLSAPDEQPAPEQAQPEQLAGVVPAQEIVNAVLEQAPVVPAQAPIADVTPPAAPAGPQIVTLG